MWKSFCRISIYVKPRPRWPDLHSMLYASSNTMQQWNATYKLQNFRMFEVRTHLEYGVTTCFHTKWRTLNYWKKFRNEPQNRLNKSGILIYSERLKRLNLPTLRYRRHRGDMMEVYKILHNIYDKEVTTGILNLSSNTSTSEATP